MFSPLKPVFNFIGRPSLQIKEKVSNPLKKNLFIDFELSITQLCIFFLCFINFLLRVGSEFKDSSILFINFFSGFTEAEV